MINKISSVLVSCLLVFLIGLQVTVFADEDSIEEVLNSQEIQDMIAQAIDSENAVGVSVVVTDGTEAYFTNSGYADKGANRKASSSTVYELGSTTKAFTALGILLLEYQGKLSIRDSVVEYIPWFHVTYNGEDADITIEQLLDHASGIPQRTMYDFPVGSSRDLLEKTVRLTEDLELDSAPGTEFQYANMNYELLGYIIEKVTGEYFEDFMQDSILTPLGMTHSTFYQSEAIASGDLAQGYSQFFFGYREYDAPRFQGCLADGWLITSTEDMSIWLNDQLDTSNAPGIYKELIERSHTIDEYNTTIASSYSGKDVYYNCGWYIVEDGSAFYHNGTNPNYTSRIIMLPEIDRAVFAVSNTQGNQTVDIANNLMNALQGYYDFEYSSDIAMLDAIVSFIMILGVIGVIGAFIRMKGTRKRVARMSEELKGKYRFFVIGRGLVYLASILLLCTWPYISQMNYTTVYVYLPLTVLLMNGVLVLFCMLALFALFYQCRMICLKGNSKEGL